MNSKDDMLQSVEMSRSFSSEFSQYSTMQYIDIDAYIYVYKHIYYIHHILHIYTIYIYYPYIYILYYILYHYYITLINSMYN